MQRKRVLMALFFKLSVNVRLIIYIIIGVSRRYLDMPVKKKGNPKGNPENLIKSSELPPEERRRRAMIASKASAEVRHRRKTYKEILDSLCAGEANKGCIMEAAQKMCKEGITIDEALNIVAVSKALLGDFSFWKEIREVREGKDPQKLEVSGTLTLEDYLKKVEDRGEY